jgi:chitinase
VPAWVSGGSYPNGAVVQNVGSKFTCLVGGWCSLANAAWAYEPGAGMYWTQAWQKEGACN